VLWLRKLGGKFGLTTDRDGPYILLHDLSAVWQAVATLSWLAVQPFPHPLLEILEMWAITGQEEIFFIFSIQEGYSIRVWAQLRSFRKIGCKSGRMLSNPTLS
jgi:hypothetical protein